MKLSRHTRGQNAGRVAGALGVALAAAPAAAFAADGRDEIERAPDRMLLWSMSAGAEISTSQFARSAEQEVVYYPVSVGLSVGGWSFGVETGYLDATLRATGLGSREVTLPSIAGRPPRTILLPTAVPIERSAQGLADTVVSARYDFLPIADTVSVALAGSVKAPTADEDKGLGSGVVDYSVSAEIGGVGRVAPYAGVGVDVLGEPEDVDYEQPLFAYAGIDAVVTNWLTLGVTYDYAEAPIETLEEYQAISGVARWRLNDHVRVSFTAAGGLSDAAPETTFGVRLSLRN